VLERRGVVGGAAVTEEFHPGFRNSVASYTVSLLNPKVIADLRLAARPARSSSARIRTSCPCPVAMRSGSAAEHDPGRGRALVAARRGTPAAVLRDARPRGRVLRELLRTPPNVRPLRAGRLAGVAGGVARAAEAGHARRRDLLELFTSPPATCSTTGSNPSR
jgi:phytoene dehydrogenase-like protein